MITKKYIKMCEKAEEIQRLFNSKEYNLLWDYTLRHDWDREKYRYKSYKKCGDKKEHTFEDIIDGYIWGCIWLPTQEQLQEMILPTLKKKYNKAWDLEKMNREGNWVIRMFAMFLQKWPADYWRNSNNLTELWIAFVMKEKYNKIWISEKWGRYEKG